MKYLSDQFDFGTTESLVKKYRIGSSKHWEGATVFWQIDSQEKVRSGKVMLYDDSGHRVKKPKAFITWAHSLLYNDYNLQQCLFGEHLLTADKSVPIAIVESEKTAVICSAYFPEFIWLAAGAKSNLKPDRCTCLMGRHVVLFPDLGATRTGKRKRMNCLISVILKSRPY